MLVAFGRHTHTYTLSIFKDFNLVYLSSDVQSTTAHSSWTFARYFMFVQLHDRITSDDFFLLTFQTPGSFFPFSLDTPFISFSFGSLGSRRYRCRDSYANSFFPPQFFTSSPWLCVHHPSLAVVASKLSIVIV